MGFNVTALAQKARTKTLIVDSDLDMGQYDVKGDTAEFSEFVGGVGNFADVIFQGGEPSGYAPIGSILAYAGNNTPNGWLSCDGSTISRTTYNALFNAIGTIYGAGDGATTFNLPDLNGKVIIGVSSSHVLASTGGAETHTLTIAQMPSHTHTVNVTAASNGAHTHTTSGTAASNGAHTHTYSKYVNGSGRGWANDYSAGGYSDTNTTSGGAHTHTVSGTAASNGAHTHTVSGTTAGSGSGSAHNNMQPYITLNYIIRAI